MVSEEPDSKISGSKFIVFFPITSWQQDSDLQRKVSKAIIQIASSYFPLFLLKNYFI